VKLSGKKESWVMEMEKAKVKQRGTVDDEFLFAVEEISMEYNYLKICMYVF
jgi:hypothetical protein